MKKWMTTFAVLAAAMMLVAQAGPDVVTRGRGVAENAEGKKGEFNFEAAKSTRNNVAVVRGNFSFSTGTPDGPRVTIRGNVNRLARNGNVAEFGGEGVIVVRTAQGQRETRGRFSVRVQDNKLPTNTDPAAVKDTFAVRFATPQNADFFGWGGNANNGFAQVIRGDIAVGPNAPTP